VLNPELAASLGADRFLSEIKTTATLQHPNLVPLFDSCEAGGLLYYVMPYLDGESLRARLEREQQLPVEDAVGIAIGIALAVRNAAEGWKTRTGISVGTPQYMRPEQATADKDITGRTDIYSLASVLYEMLAGQPPHLGGSAQQIIMRIIAEPVEPVTKLRKTVPPHVAAAIAKALEKLPADRFESAKAFASALANPAFAPVRAAVPALTSGRATGVGRHRLGSGHARAHVLSRDASRALQRSVRGAAFPIRCSSGREALPHDPPRRHERRRAGTDCRGAELPRGVEGEAPAMTPWASRIGRPMTSTGRPRAADRSHA